MNLAVNNQLFKKIVILFWAFWWLIAFWTDVVGGLAHLQVLNASWAPDTNYPFLVSTLKMYNVPDYVPLIFYIAIIVWSFLSAILFFWASLALARPENIWLQRAKVAFIVSLSFWLAFFLADQLVMKFDLEENHMVQGGFEFLCFLSMYLLPTD